MFKVLKCDADFYTECEYVKDGYCQLTYNERLDCCPIRNKVKGQD